MSGSRRWKFSFVLAMAVCVCLGEIALAAPPQPIATGIAPTLGTTAGGTTVTITGTNLQVVRSVTFGGVPGTIVSKSKTILTATTPTHAVGTVDVTVFSNQSSSTLAQAFTYVLPPQPTSITPTFGDPAGGTSVTIGGTSFQNGATVSLGGTPATNVVVVDPTTITAVTGAHAAGVVNVVVTNPDNVSGTLANGYTYGIAPTVSSVTPSSGPTAGGTNVTILGSDFQNGALVNFGGVPASNIVVNGPSSISATTPPHAAGAADVVVTNPDNLSGTLSNGFTYGASPTVSSVSPSTGPAAGGTNVTIDGTNFQNGATVSFGGAVATAIVVVNATTITCTTTAHPAGIVDVVVTNPDAQQAILVNGFTYGSAPAVAAIAPDFGTTAGGTNVTITGGNFQNGATATIGGASVVGLTFISTTTLTGQTPPRATPGAVDVVVTNPDTQSGTLTNGYTYVPAPAVTGVDPVTGSAAGGTGVTITGANFASGATVSFGGAVATAIVVVNSTTITCTTTSHAAGVVDVTVTNTDGFSGTLVNGYTYGSGPAVTGIVPSTGSTAGGTSVTISGTNFVPGATVDIGGSPATSVVFVDPNTLTAVTPAHAVGAVDVVVTNPDTLFGTLANGFTYGAEPVVLSIDPVQGTTAGGTNVTVTGTNFKPAAMLVLGGVSASNVNVVSSTTITATTGARNAATVDVTVTNTDNLSGTLANGFTYCTPPITVLSAPLTVPVNATARIASAANHPGNTYLWAINGDSNSPLITSGQATSQTTFSADVPGATMIVSVTETAASCFAVTATQAVQVDFLDVPPPDVFHDYITTLARNGVTKGCGNGNYCPTSSVTRGQMAAFLLRAEHGGGYAPPPATGTIFGDVTTSTPLASFIERLYNEGITNGCSASPLLYCPASTVTRAQMAKFLLRTRFGPNFVPPTATGTVFQDVAAGSFLADWIEELATEGVTSGCSANPPLYCPSNSVLRNQMAKFIVKMFVLQ